MSTLVDLALLGLTDRQKAALLKLHEHFDDNQDAPRKLIDSCVRCGSFVKKVSPRRWEFTDLGEAVIAALKSSTTQAASGSAQEQS